MLGGVDALSREQTGTSVFELSQERRSARVPPGQLQLSPQQTNALGDGLPPFDQGRELEIQTVESTEIRVQLFG